MHTINWKEVANVVREVAQSGAKDGVVVINGEPIGVRIATFRTGREVAAGLRSSRSYLLRPCSVNVKASGEKGTVIIAAMLLDKLGEWIAIEPGKSLNCKTDDSFLLAEETTGKIIAEVDENANLLGAIQGQDPKNSTAVILVYEKVGDMADCAITVYSGVA